MTHLSLGPWLPWGKTVEIATGAPQDLPRMEKLRLDPGGFHYVYTTSQWIGLREILQESPIFNGKIYGFL